MNFPKKKKAFTLTELLVVVIVLGVLAGVAAPKFKRVLETRKTTEAENMLAAVRTEQEKRCIMGKNYLTDASKVAALASAGTSANYTYSLTSSGVSAASKGASNAYTIKILSYKNGTLCCDGDGCAALNKNYVSCDSVTVPADECSAESGSSVVEPTPEPEACVPESHSSSFDIGSGEEWSGTCWKSRKKTCDEEGNASWTETLNYCSCDTAGYKWDGSTENCVEETKTCSGSSSQTVSIDNGTCTQTRTCDTSTGNWGGWQTDESTCSCESGYTYNNTSKKCEPEPEPEQTCDANSRPADETKNMCGCSWTKTPTCNSSTGEWSAGSWSKNSSSCTPSGDGCVPGTIRKNPLNPIVFQHCNTSCTWKNPPSYDFGDDTTTVTEGSTIDTNHRVCTCETGSSVCGPNSTLSGSVGMGGTGHSLHVCSENGVVVSTTCVEKCGKNYGSSAGGSYDDTTTIRPK